MKLTTEDRVMILQSLWCKERELQQALEFRIENNFDDDIISKYRGDLEHVIKLSDSFLEWEF